MPRGVPKSGFRKSKNWRNNQLKNSMELKSVPLQEIPTETDGEIEERISDRFDIMHQMAHATALGKNRALIVSGPPGLGKSFGVTKVLKGLTGQGVVSDQVSGFTRATGLYRKLYENRDQNHVLVFDDCDSVFMDDVSINILKRACDTTRDRTISWSAETRMETDNGDRLPTSFDFGGSVIFITNYDFDRLIAGNHKIAPHLEALVSRSHYLDLTLKTERDYLVRIRQVVAKGMLLEHGLDRGDEFAVMHFVENNYRSLRELSLRMVVKLANLIAIDRPRWQKIARATCFKKGY